MSTTPNLLSPGGKTEQLSPNVLSPHIDASILLRRRSSFQFKFLSKVNEFRDALLHAVTFKNEQEHAHADNIVVKVEKAEEAYLQENFHNSSRTFADKWTQTEDEYFNHSSKVLLDFSTSVPSVTPTNVTKRKISVNSAVRNTVKNLTSTFEDKTPKVQNKTFEKEINIEDLDSSFFDENGLICAKYILTNEEDIPLSDSVKSFLDNERQTQEILQDFDHDANVTRSLSTENFDENAEHVSESGTSSRRKIPVDKFIAIDVMNSTEMSLSQDTEDGPLDNSLYYSSMPEHILEQSCRINTPPFIKTKRVTSSPTLQDSGYEHHSSSGMTMSGETRFILDNSFIDSETEEKDIEFENESRSNEKKRIIATPEMGLNDQTFNY